MGIWGWKLKQLIWCESSASRLDYSSSSCISHQAEIWEWGTAHGSGEADIRMPLRGYEMFCVVNIAFLILNFGPWSARLLLASWNKISVTIWNLQDYWFQTNLSCLRLCRRLPSCRHPWRRQQQQLLQQQQLAFSGDKFHNVNKPTLLLNRGFNFAFQIN